jgi:hypothetical protein
MERGDVVFQHFDVLSSQVTSDSQVFSPYPWHRVHRVTMKIERSLTLARHYSMLSSSRIALAQQVRKYGIYSQCAKCVMVIRIFKVYEKLAGLSEKPMQPQFSVLLCTLYATKKSSRGHLVFNFYK